MISSVAALFPFILCAWVVGIVLQILLKKQWKDSFASACRFAFTEETPRPQYPSILPILAIEIVTYTLFFMLGASVFAWYLLIHHTSPLILL